MIDAAGPADVGLKTAGDLNGDVVDIDEDRQDDALALPLDAVCWYRNPDGTATPLIEDEPDLAEDEPEQTPGGCEALGSAPREWTLSCARAAIGFVQQSASCGDRLDDAATVSPSLIDAMSR